MQILTPIDIVSPFRNLKTTADSVEAPTSFSEGYQLAINHAIELAELLQVRIDLRHSFLWPVVRATLSER